VVDRLFQVATALLLLVQEELLPPVQRLEALFVIVELFHFDPRENPFLAPLLDILESVERPFSDRWFLSQLLSSGPKEVRSSSAVVNFSRSQFVGIE
jgi:hypothetical protein